MKVDKYVSKAFKSCNVFRLEHIYTTSDLDLELTANRDLIEKCKIEIEVMKGYIEDCTRNIELLEAVQSQVKVERYKELNPGKEIFHT